MLAESCNKAEKDSGNSPTCQITSPKNGKEILLGEIVSISVEAADADGRITEVIINIDSIDVGKSNSIPYQYLWNTADNFAGIHIIKATAFDNNSNHTSHKINVLILKEDSSVLETGTVNDYDGNTYRTVKIGTQWWMAENLKTTHFPDGKAIPLIENNVSWDNLGFSDKAYCYYTDSVSRPYTYGALYNWAAAMNGSQSSEKTPSQVQGVCPDCWHLPSDGEWIVLEMQLGMSYEEAWLMGWRGTNEGTKMKAKEAWDNNGNGTNSSGFSALPAGIRSDKGLFSDAGKATHFWSTTEYVNMTNLAFNRKLSYNQPGVGWFHASHLYGYPKDFGFSVRCVKD